MWDMHDTMEWWMTLGSVGMLLSWTVLVAGVAWLISIVAGDGRSGDGDALRVAKQRYARGEISREEFRRISADLATSGHS